MADLTEPRFLSRTSPPHILTLVMLAGLSALAMNVFLPSLPKMTTYFQTDYAVMQLSVSAYLALNGVLQLVIGPLSDRYGRRPVILWGIVVFCLATVGCLLSTSIEMFLFFRMIQTSVSVGLVLSRAIVRDMVPADQAASMIGYVTMGMSLVPMIAPAIGGFLDELYGWQANFAILLFLGVLTWGLIWADLGETNTHQSASFAAQFADYPELFGSRRFWGYCLTAALAAGAFFAFLGGAPFVATNHYNLSASALGLYFGFVSLGYLLGNFLSGRYSSRVGINLMMQTGSVVALCGLAFCLLLLLSGFDHPIWFFGAMLAVGIGNGMVLPNANAGMVSVRPHLAGTASGLGGAILLLGGASLAALAGALLTKESGPYPLLAVMITVTVLSLAMIRYIIRVERQSGPLEPPKHRPPA